MRKHYLLGLVISITFLYLVLHKVKLSETIKVIKSANPFYFILIIILLIFVLICRSFRWKIMSSDYKTIPITKFFESLSVALMTNNIIPFRAGDIVQVLFLGYKTELSKSTILSTVIMEKLCDFFVMGFIIFCSSFFVLLPKIFSVEKVGILLLIIIACLIIAIKFRDKLIGLIDKMLPENRVKVKIKNIIKKFYSGLEFFNQLKIFLTVIFFTIIIWFLCSLQIYFIMISAGIKLNIFVAIFILALTGLAAIVPSSPGYIGSLEFLVITGLGIFGIDESQAFGFTIIYRLMTWLPITLLGMLILIKNNISIKDIKRMSRE